MTVASATRETRGVGGLGRLIVALPLLALFACAAAVYAWQGSRLVTPWTYYDELLYADLARAVAGTTSRLGAGSLASSPHLYPIVIAPAWLFRTETAYEL